MNFQELINAIKNVALAIVIGAGVFMFFQNKKETPLSPIVNLGPKKLLVFTIYGGGGHQSVCKTLNGYLSKKYNISQINIMDILSSIDPIRKISFNKYSGDSLYNYFLKNNWIRSANVLGTIGKTMVLHQSKKVEKLLTPLVEKENPSCIISVIPYFNAPLYAIAQKKNIPFLIVTNDLDTQNYTIGLKSPKYSKFKYTLAFDNENMRKKIASNKFAESQIKVTGFPLRPDFYEEKAKDEIRKSFGIPANRPTVLLMMGAAGSQALCDYVQEFTQMEMPLHVVVCLGRNKQLRKDIEALIEHSTDVSFTLLDFTDRVSDLMAVSHLMVTKPGPNSICEAMQMNLPVLLDSTNPTLYWEQFNIKFVQNHAVGGVITSREKMKPLIDEFLLNPGAYKTLKKNIAGLKKPDFPNQIDQLLKEMLGEENKIQ